MIVTVSRLPLIPPQAHIHKKKRKEESKATRTKKEMLEEKVMHQDVCALQKLEKRVGFPMILQK